MSQMSFGDAQYAGKRKKTRREIFLEEMNQVVPWKSLLAVIEPLYPIAGRRRHPYPPETMLRVHLMQNWFVLSDPAMEEALDEMAPMRAFGRSLQDLVGFAADIRSKTIDFYLYQPALDTSIFSRKAMLAMLGVFAKLAWSMIQERATYATQTLPSPAMCGFGFLSVTCTR